MTYPESEPRRSSRLTGVLCVIAFLLVAALVVAVIFVIVDSRRDNSTSATVTMTATTTPPASSTPPAAAPTPTVTETATEEPTPTGSTPVQGGQCYESEARSFGTAADGTSLVCAYLGAGGGYQWVLHGDNDGETHNIGEPCDPSVDRVSTDPQGKAILCGGQTWVANP